MSEHRLVLIILCLLGGGGCYYSYKNSPTNMNAPSQNWVPPIAQPLPEVKPAPAPVQPVQPKPVQPKQQQGGGCFPRIF